METKKKPTKKQFIAAMRAGDRTTLFRLYKLLRGGEHFKWHEMYLFLKDIAPSKKLEIRAFDLSHTSRLKGAHHERYTGRYGYFAPLEKQAARLFFEEEFNRGFDNYTKVATICYCPEMQDFFLCGASPVYGCRDYNKAILLRVKGNENACGILVKKIGVGNTPWGKYLSKGDN